MSQTFTSSAVSVSGKGVRILGCHTVTPEAMGMGVGGIQDTCMVVKWYNCTQDTPAKMLVQLCHHLS